MKLYIGKGQRAPCASEHRSRVRLKGCMPYTFTNRFADTLTFGSWMEIMVSAWLFPKSEWTNHTSGGDVEAYGGVGGEVGHVELLD